MSTEMIVGIALCIAVVSFIAGFVIGMKAASERNIKTS